MEQLSTGPVHLVGHSYAGYIAAQIACTKPELLLSLFDCFPVAEKVIIPDASHLVNIDNHPLFCKALDSFLTSLPSGLTVLFFHRAYDAQYCLVNWCRNAMLFPQLYNHWSKHINLGFAQSFYVL